jgi:hypothetical protein
MSKYQNISKGIRASMLVVAILLSLRGELALAQATSAVTGVVTDQSGGVIVGVQITLSNTRTGFEFSVTTNQEGTYQFLLVPPGGGYALTFSKDDFNTLTVADLALGVGVTETKDAR